MNFSHGACVSPSVAYDRQDAMPLHGKGIELKIYDDVFCW